MREVWSFLLLTQLASLALGACPLSGSDKDDLYGKGTEPDRLNLLLKHIHLLHLILCLLPIWALHWTQLVSCARVTGFYSSSLVNTQIWLWSIQYNNYYIFCVIFFFKTAQSRCTWSWTPQRVWRWEPNPMAPLWTRSNCLLRTLWINSTAGV